MRYLLNAWRLSCRSRANLDLFTVSPACAQFPVARASAPEVEEVVLALAATVDGQTTAHYLAERLAGAAVTVTHLAQGVPIGGALDILDDGTLAAAMKARRGR